MRINEDERIYSRRKGLKSTWIKFVLNIKLS